MSAHHDTAPKPYGMVASFRSPEELLSATQAARDAGYSKMDAYSPIPIEGLVEALNFRDDRLFWITLLGGLTGAITGLALEIWTSNVAYAHNAGGKPLTSWPMFFPVLYECTILFAAFGATFGMIGLCGLPKPHQTIFNANIMSRASQDRFLLCIEAEDPSYEQEAIASFFRAQNAEEFEPVMTSEGY